MVATSERDVDGDSGQRTVSGRYRLLGLIGSGGMGRVWRAYDEVLEREVAVKELVTPAAAPMGDRRGMRLRAVRQARAAAEG